MPDRADSGGRSVVQRVIGPLVGTDGAEALYAEGVTLGGAVPTPTGPRRAMTVEPGGTASLGTFFNAFPAAYWARWTAASTARLELEVDAEARVELLTSDARGVVVARAATDAAPRTPAVLDADLTGLEDGGFLWVTVTARSDPASIVGGSWSVDAAPVRGGAPVLGTPTMDRAPFVVRTLGRLLAAPALLERVQRVVLVDQGGTPVVEAEGFAEASSALGPLLRSVRQGNFGGAGGYSRTMLEALDEPGAGFVVLLDDDVDIEPEALLRAHDFGLRTSLPVLVGGQMLDIGRRSAVRAAAERIDARTFWWSAVDPATVHDHAGGVLSATPALHRRLDTDYLGWWMCQVPLEVVRGIGLALPLFLKWDDAEFALRAADHGSPAVSLPGTAVWHVDFRSKDDSLDWPAFFHSRNRVVAGMIHRASPLRLAGHSLALDVKQLLAMQYPASRLRHAGIRAALAGPRALERRPGADRARATAIVRTEPALHRRPAAPADRTAAPVGAPPTMPLPLWAARTLVRQIRQSHTTEPVVLERGAWWALARHPSARVPTADGAEVLEYRFDRGALLAGLAAAVGLHALLVAAWPVTAWRWRRVAARLASPASWRRRLSRS